MLMAGLIAAGCNQPFEPDGGYDARLVVYAVLASPQDTQYVRIGRTSTTGETIDVAGATAEIIPANGDPPVQLRDTLVMHGDGAGGTAPYHVYAAYNFTPKSRVAYRVSVASAGSGTAGATAVGLGPADATLEYPGGISVPDSLLVVSRIASPQGAFVPHPSLAYQVTAGGNVTGGSAEVPVGTSVDAAGNVSPVYPAFARVPAGLGTATTSSAYSGAMYRMALAGVVNAHPEGSVTVTEIRYTVSQIDDALYDYFYVRNGPPDTGTLRLDTPEFTDVTGGLGVIGCMQIITRTVPVAH